MRIYSINLGAAAALTGRAQSVALGGSVSAATATFSTPMANANYALVTSISNVVDANPIDLWIIETAKTSSGFTVTFNAPTDTANYVLEYVVTAYV